MTEDLPKNCLIDMGGVLVSGSTMIPGADRFIERLKRNGTKFLVSTNSPLYTPGDLVYRLQAMGLDVSAGSIFTSAMAMARFLRARKPGGTAFVIGESGLTEPILVLSGVTERDDVDRYPYHPTRVVESVAEIDI